MFVQASGGAIYVAGFKTVLIDGCTFDANSAVPAGGALFVADNKDVQLKNNKFYSNYVHSSTKVQPFEPLWIMHQGKQFYLVVDVNIHEFCGKLENTISVFIA